jgi:hypothetical protein
MSTIERHLTRITMIAAVLAAAFTALPAHAAPRDVRVVQLPTVVVTAKRVPVVHLERVVVIGKRLVPAATVVAQRGARGERV